MHEGGSDSRVIYDDLMLTKTGVGSPPVSTSSVLARLSTTRAWAVVVAASAALGFVMSKSAALATVHLVATLGAVVVVAALSRRPDLILAVTVYAGLCDVLWRSSSALGPYEGSKYALVVGFGLLAIRFLKQPKNLALCASLVLLLIPGAAIGAMTLGLGPARQLVSSNLSGLVAIAAAVLACSNLRLSLTEMRGIYLIALSPIIAVTAQATASTVASKDLTFTDEVNFATSGGFGPNQVSSLLCLGGLLCVLVIVQRGVRWHLRVLALGTGVWLVGQAVLTFSRGGLFALVLAGAGVGLVALTLSGQRARVLIAAGLLVVVAVQVLSWAGAFTDGASEDRLSSTDSTNRADIAKADIQLFLERPIVGVGVGVSVYERDYGQGTVAPHTEYTRLLAEHGLLGLAVIGVLTVICVRLVRTADGWYRMAAVGLLVMAVAQMTHSATRIGSIAVAFGLAALLEDPD